MYKVQPDIRAAVEPGEDGFKVHRDLAGLVSARLAAGPVEQLQVLVERHKQTAAVAAATRRCSVAGGLMGLMGPIGPIRPIGPMRLPANIPRTGRFYPNRSQPAGFGTVVGLSLLSFLRGGELCELSVGDAVVNACEFAGFGGLRDGSADGVEVDVGETGGDGGFIEQRLDFEAGFPEVPGDIVFKVGTFGDGF